MFLGLETAFDTCSLALFAPGEERRVLQEHCPRAQAVRLFPLLGEFLESCGVDWSALSGVAVCRGPGSFTGIRIGLAAARGLGLAAGCPVFGVDAFTAFARSIDSSKNPENFLIVLETRRQDFYACFFETPAGPGFTPLVGSAFEILDQCPVTPRHLFGNAAARFYEEADLSVEVHETPAEIDPFCLAREAWKQQATPESLPPFPLYLKKPDVASPSGGV